MNDQAELKKRLSYDPLTGDFTWLNGPKQGQIAGTTTNTGYVQISIGHTLYLAHRLAFLYMTGEWPENQIDHKDEYRSNNKWENLRPATHSQNKMHTPIQINNTTGYKGVRFDQRRNKYTSTIKVDNISRFLGYFDDPKEAYEAYVEAAKVLHGEFAYV